MEKGHQFKISLECQGSNPPLLVYKARGLAPMPQMFLQSEEKTLIHEYIKNNLVHFGLKF